MKLFKQISACVIGAVAVVGVTVIAAKASIALALGVAAFTVVKLGAGAVTAGYVVGTILGINVFTAVTGLATWGIVMVVNVIGQAVEDAYEEDRVKSLGGHTIKRGVLKGAAVYGG